MTSEINCAHGRSFGPRINGKMLAVTQGGKWAAVVACGGPAESRAMRDSPDCQTDAVCRAPNKVHQRESTEPLRARQGNLALWR